jgi:hypothetical protein
VLLAFSSPARDQNLGYISHNGQNCTQAPMCDRRNHALPTALCSIASILKGMHVVGIGSRQYSPVSSIGRPFHLSFPGDVEWISPYVTA